MCLEGLKGVCRGVACSGDARSRGGGGRPMRSVVQHETTGGKALTRMQVLYGSDPRAQRYAREVRTATVACGIDTMLQMTLRGVRSADPFLPSCDAD